MDNSILMILFSVNLFFLSVLFCILPKFAMRNRIIAKKFSYIHIFTAGMQLATLMVDLIPHLLESSNHSHDHSHDHNHNHSIFPFTIMGYSFIVLLAIDKLLLNREDEVDSIHDHHHHYENSISCCNTDLLSHSKSSFQAVILLLTISFHSFFEGLAVKEIKKSIAFIIGLSIHKLTESFALGVSLLASKLTYTSALSLFIIYSFLTPFGIIISTAVSKLNNNFTLWINCLSLGGFMFIVFIEMISRGFKQRKNNISNIILLTLGYSMGVGIEILSHN